MPRKRKYKTSVNCNWQGSGIGNFRVVVDIVNPNAKRVISACFLEKRGSNYYQPSRIDKNCFSKFKDKGLARQAISNFVEREDYLHRQFFIQSFDDKMGIWETVDTISKKPPSLEKMVKRLKSIKTHE